MRLLLATCAAVLFDLEASASTAVFSEMPVPLHITAESFGSNSIRVRVSVPGINSTVEPPISGLVSLPPDVVYDGHQHSSVVLQDAATATAVASPIPPFTNGNLVVSVTTDGLITATRRSDGAVLLRQTALTFGKATEGAQPGSVSAVAAFEGPEAKEQIYGLGEQRTGRVNQNGAAAYHDNFSESLSYYFARGGISTIPFYMSSKGYGFIWNTASLGSVDIQAKNDVGAGHFTWETIATQSIDVWITTSPAPSSSSSPSPSVYADLMHQFSDAVGHPIPMPSWTTGFIQCKNRYRRQSQLMDVARGYKERGLPISMIVIDWFHWPEMGDFELDPKCWPDPQGMVDELKANDIELMITFWPFIGMNVSRNWEEYRDKKWLATNTSDGQPDSIWRYNTPTGNALIDATNEEALKATYDKWYDGYGKYGVRAAWLDAAEPAHNEGVTVITGGQWRLKEGLDAEVIGGGWTKEWIRGFHEKMQRMNVSEGNYFTLGRHGWFGTAASGAGLWSGDIYSKFDELKLQVKVGQTVAMSGIPLWTTDIGGYSTAANDPEFPELIVRWFQFGAFSPLFRLHGLRPCYDASCQPDECGMTNGDNEVWNLATPGTDHYDAIVAVMFLRESLRDYVQEINGEAVARGWPMMRPMVFHFPDILDDSLAAAASAGAEDTKQGNEGERNVEAQFMLGPKWLVAPVTTYNATTWPVYLPQLEAGFQWVFHWNNTPVVLPEGDSKGQWVAVDVSSNITHFPLFEMQQMRAKF